MKEHLTCGLYWLHNQFQQQQQKKSTTQEAHLFQAASKMLLIITKESLHNLIRAEPSVTWNETEDDFKSKH